MGSIYKGFGGHKTYVGYCEDGVIYSGRTPIGRYENGNIYNQFKEHIGSYSGGSIYNQFNEHVGSYEGGSVYNKYLNATFGKEQIGSYDGDPAAAAALILLFIGERAANGTNDKDSENGDSTSVSSSGASSETGFLSAIFALLWGIISFLFVVVIPFYFVYILAPSYLGLSWVGLLCAVLSILFASTGIVPLAIPFILVFSIIETLFGIYWVLVIIIKIKTRCTRIDVLKLFGKWFLKGPFAFVDVANIMSENNIMPRITRLLNKIFDRVRKTSK